MREPLIFTILLCEIAERGYLARGKDQMSGTPQHCGVQPEEYDAPFRIFGLSNQASRQRLAQIQLTKLAEVLQGKLQSRFVSHCATRELTTHLVAHGPCSSYAGPLCTGEVGLHRIDRTDRPN